MKRITIRLLKAEPQRGLIRKRPQVWRWRAQADNGRILASGESYVNRQDCIDTIQALFSDDSTDYYLETAEGLKALIRSGTKPPF